MRIVLRVEQRTVGVSAVLVGISKQKFTDGDQIAIFNLGTSALARAIPIKRRLTNTILESERLESFHIFGWQSFNDFKGSLPK